MKKFFTNKYTLIVLGVIVLFLLWFLVSLIVKNPIIFPDPFLTIKTLFEMLGDAYIYKCLGSSFLRLIIGFIIGGFLGFIFGIIFSYFKKGVHVFKPTLIAIKAIPTAAIIFLFVALAGYENAPVLIVALVTFPILYESTLAGLSNIPNEYKDELKLSSSNFLHSLIEVKLFFASSYILVGLLTSFALAFKIEIMSEIIAGNTTYGIGVAIKTATQLDAGNMVPVFAYSLFVILLILLIN